MYFTTWFRLFLIFIRATKVNKDFQEIREQTAQRFANSLLVRNSLLCQNFITVLSVLHEIISFTVRLG